VTPPYPSDSQGVGGQAVTSRSRGGAPAPGGETPVHAFVNARVLTMTSDAEPVEVVVIRGDRIAGLGRRADLAGYPDAQLHDLGGKLLCPGFIDAHHHLSIAALHPSWADVSWVRTPDELADVLRAYAARNPAVPWIRAANWTDLESTLSPTRRDLDALGLDRPVLVAHYSLHQGVVNSLGLDALGISRASPDPPGGEIGRDKDGSPNGLLIERAWSEAHSRSLSPYDDPELWAEHIAALALSLPADGITAVHDIACPPQAEAAYRRLAASGDLPVSVLACPHPARLLFDLEADRLDGAPTGDGDEHVRVGPVKLFADGGVAPALDVHVGGRSMAFGMLFEGLGEQVEAAVSKGFRVAVHALGNAGLDAALNAFTAAARVRDLDHRFRVEHVCLASPAQLERLGALGGIAVVQPGFLHHLGRQVEGVSFDDATWLPFAEVERSGAVMAASSDCPCTFYAPLRTSAHGANRRTGSGNVLDIAQAVSYEDWLRAYTAGAAYAGGQETERGSLAPGLRADLVVLDGELDADDPPTVAQTWIGGRLVYEAK
jgi:predicted amidohydrolase YtcJ